MAHRNHSSISVFIGLVVVVVLAAVVVRTLTNTAEPKPSFVQFSLGNLTAQVPAWTPIDPQKNPVASQTKLALQNAGCGFVISELKLPETDLPTYMESLIADQQQKTNIEVVSKDLTPTTSSIETQFPRNDLMIRSSQHGYLATGGTFYSLVFSADARTFPFTCAPTMEKVIESVKVL